jgi:hypothetical protein
MHRGNAQVIGTPKRKAFIAPKLVLSAPGNSPPPMRGWAHSSFGRKIEKAVHMREKGSRIAIVAEPYWVGQLRQSSLAVDGGHL